MSEFEIPHIPEMAGTVEVNYLGCTCFLPSKLFLRLRGDRRTQAERDPTKADSALIYNQFYTRVQSSRL